MKCGTRVQAPRSFPLPMGVIEAERKVTAPIRNPKPATAKVVRHQVTVAAILAVAAGW